MSRCRCCAESRHEQCQECGPSTKLAHFMGRWAAGAALHRQEPYQSGSRPALSCPATGPAPSATCTTVMPQPGKCLQMRCACRRYFQAWEERGGASDSATSKRQRDDQRRLVGRGWRRNCSRWTHTQGPAEPPVSEPCRQGGPPSSGAGDWEVMAGADPPSQLQRLLVQRLGLREETTLVTAPGRPRSKSDGAAQVSSSSASASAAGIAQQQASVLRWARPTAHDYQHTVV